MALSYPIAAANFWGGLSITEATFDLPDTRIHSGTDGGGSVYTANLGTRLWYGTATLANEYHMETAARKAAIEDLTRAGTSFLVYDPSKQYPADDPDGTKLGAAVPRISSVAANNLDLTIKDLPVGYVLTKGDLLSFQYGSNPVRYALHRVLVGGTANGSGVVTVTLSSFIRSGATVNLNITLVRAHTKAIITPQSARGGSIRSVMTDGSSFGWQQTLR